MGSDLEITCEKADSFSSVSTPPSFQLNNSKGDFLTESSNDSSEKMVSNKAVNISENIEKDESKQTKEIIKAIDLKSSDMLETKRELDYSGSIFSSSILCSPHFTVINESSDEVLTVKQNISLGQSFSKSPDQNRVVTDNGTCLSEFSFKKVNKRKTRILKDSFKKKKPCRSKKKYSWSKKASKKIPRDKILSTMNELGSDDKFDQMSAVDSMCTSSSASHKHSRVFNYLSDILKKFNISKKKLNKSEAKLFKRGYEETSRKIQRKIRKVFRRKLSRKMYKKSKLKKESLVHNTDKHDKTSSRGNSNELSAENNVQNDLDCNKQPQDSNIFPDILEEFNTSPNELSKFEAKLYKYGFKEISKEHAKNLRKCLKTNIQKKVTKRIISAKTSEPSNGFPVHFDNKLDNTSYIPAEDPNAVKAQMNVDILTNEEIKHSPSSVSDDFLEGSITKNKENLISNNKDEVSNIAKLEKKTNVMSLESVNFYVPNNNEAKNKLTIHAEKSCKDVQLLGTTSSNSSQNIAVNEKSRHEMMIKNDNYFSNENASHNTPMVVNQLSNKAVNISENIEKDESEQTKEIMKAIDLKSSDMLETKRELDYSGSIFSSSILCSPHFPVINESSDEVLTVKQNISLGQSFSKSPDQNQVVTDNGTCLNEFFYKKVNKRKTRILKDSFKKKKYSWSKKASKKIPRDKILSTMNESGSDDKFDQMSAVDSMCTSSSANHKHSRVFNYLSDILKKFNISKKQLNKSEAKLFKRGYEETSRKIQRKIRKVFRRKLSRKMYKKSKLKKESLVHNTDKHDKTSSRGNSNELSAENNVQNDLDCNKQPQDSNIFPDILEEFNTSPNELSKFEAKLYKYGFKEISKEHAKNLRKCLKTNIQKKVTKRIISAKTSEPSNGFPVHFDNKLDNTSYIPAEDPNAVKAQMNVDILTNEEIKHSPSSVSDDFLEGSITQNKENLISNNKDEVSNIARLENKTNVMSLESVNFYVPNNNEAKNKLTIHAEKSCKDIELLGTTSSNSSQNIAVIEKSRHEMMIKNDNYFSNENASHNTPTVINQKDYQYPKFWLLSNFLGKPDISLKNIPGTLNDPIAPDKEMSMQYPLPCDFGMITIKNIERDHNYSSPPPNHVISKSNNDIHVDSSPVSPLSNEPQNNSVDLESFKKSFALTNLNSYEMLNKTQNIEKVRETVKTTVHDQNDSDKLVQLMSGALNDSETDVLKEKSLDANDYSIIKDTRDKISPIISYNLLKEKKHKTTFINSSLSTSNADRITISNSPKKSASKSKIRSNESKSKIITPEKECHRNDEIYLKGKKSSIIKIKENIKISHPKTKKKTEINPNSTVIIKPKVGADSSYFSISVNTSLSKPENQLSESPRKKMIHTNPLSLETTNESSLTKSTPVEFSKIRIIGQKEGSGSSTGNLITNNPSYKKKRETTSDVNVNNTKIIITPVKKSSEKGGRIFMRDKKISNNSNNIVTNNVQEKDNRLSSFSHLNGFLNPENVINSISDPQENCGQLSNLVQSISDKAMESHNEYSDSKTSNDGNLLPFDHIGKNEFGLSSSSFCPDFHDLKIDLSSISELSQENYDQLTKIKFQCSVPCERINLCSNYHFKNAKMRDSLNTSKSLQDNFKKSISSRISSKDSLSKLDFKQNSPPISVAESIHLSKEDSSAIILNSCPKDLSEETHFNKALCATGPVIAEFQKNTKDIAAISSNLNGSCSNEAKDCVSSDGKNIPYIELSDSEEDVQILKCFDNKISTNEKNPLELVHSKFKECETKNLGTKNYNPKFRTDDNFLLHVSIKESPSKMPEKQKSYKQTHLTDRSSQDINAFKQSPSKAKQQTIKAHEKLSTESNRRNLLDCGITYTKSPKKSTNVNSSQVSCSSPKRRRLSPSPVTVKSDINTSATSNKEDIDNIHCSSNFDSDCFIIDSVSEPQLIIID
ncbi:hypothetical protein TNCV_1482211 [Trichonephila clavipes]|nr:hypothetical protein TNCV_1482211 [Trichonephila clavipes]